MKDFSKPRTYILSAHRAERTASENNTRHAELCCDLALAGVPYRVAQGSFGGVYEQSIIISGVAHEDTVQRLAEEYAQDSYLVIAENDRTAYIVDTATGYHTHIGKLENVGEDAPDGDYTYIDGFYFTTDGKPGVDLLEGL